MTTAFRDLLPHCLSIILGYNVMNTVDQAVVLTVFMVPSAYTELN